MVAGKRPHAGPSTTHAERAAGICTFSRYIDGPRRRVEIIWVRGANPTSVASPAHHESSNKTMRNLFAKIILCLLACFVLCGITDATAAPLPAPYGQRIVAPEKV